MKFRLILDPPRHASLNMAIDEILMESQRAATSLPTLRLYSWNSLCYTLGYFQTIEEQRRRFPKGETLVRRITGGGLVRHGEDLTFSLTIKEINSFFPKDVKTSYLKINEALRHGLKADLEKLDYADCKTVPSIGQTNRHSDSRICFEAPVCYDLLLAGKKVVGASQRRKYGVLLHQSSVLIKMDQNQLIQAVLQGFKEKWRVEFIEEPLTPEELNAAHQRELERYSDPLWASPVEVATKV